MVKVNVVDISGSVLRSIDLDDRVFGIKSEAGRVHHVAQDFHRSVTRMHQEFALLLDDGRERRRGIGHSLNASGIILRPH